MFYVGQWSRDAGSLDVKQRVLCAVYRQRILLESFKSAATRHLLTYCQRWD